MTEQAGPRKIATYTEVSAAVLADGGFLVPELFTMNRRTPEQIAADDAARKERADAVRSVAVARHEAARPSNAELRAVFDHHGPHVDDYYPEPAVCQGCDLGPNAEAWAEWPCSTWCLITGQDA